MPKMQIVLYTKKPGPKTRLEKYGTAKLLGATQEDPAIAQSAGKLYPGWK